MPTKSQNKSLLMGKAKFNRVQLLLLVGAMATMGAVLILLTHAATALGPTDFRIDQRGSSSIVVSWIPPTFKVRRYNFYADGKYVTSICCGNQPNPNGNRATFSIFASFGSGTHLAVRSVDGSGHESVDSNVAVYPFKPPLDFRIDVRHGDSTTVSWIPNTDSANVDHYNFYANGVKVGSICCSAKPNPNGSRATFGIYSHILPGEKMVIRAADAYNHESLNSNVATY